MISRPRILVLVGLPGSGKSTWLARNRLPALSSDDVRRLLADDPTDQNIHRKVFAVIRSLLRQRLAADRPLTCIDSTSLVPRERRPYIRLAEEFDCEVEAVFFDVPLSVCQARNRERERVVPEEVVERMAAKLVPPSLEEGFLRITVIRD